MDCSKCTDCSNYKPHKWRVQCQSCNCPSYHHKSFVSNLLSQLSVAHDNNNGIIWINKLKCHKNHNQLNDHKDSMELAEKHDLLWLPIGLEEDKIDEFMKIWKSLINHESKLINKNSNPILSYSLDNSRDNQINRAILFAYQMPASDWFQSSLEDVNSTTENGVETKGNEEEQLFGEHANELFKDKMEINYKQMRDEKSFGFGELDLLDGDAEDCHFCHEPIKEESVYSVQITHKALKSWHIGCFKCATCHSITMDLHYFWDDASQNIYCMRHFGDKQQNRCGACDELIFDQDFTKAMSQEFHVDHFVCNHCEKSLTGERYILREDKAICMECFNDKFSYVCDRCNKKISCETKDLSFNDRHWHYECFYCDACNESLYEKQFGGRDNQIFCPGCYENKFQARCDKCGEVFRQGSKKFEYGGQQWHETCFLCCNCGVEIGSRGFVPKKSLPEKQDTQKDTAESDEKQELEGVKEQSECVELFCIACYEDKYGQKCSKCKGVIRKGGVTYHGVPWHRECFLCTKCNCLLADIKFTSKDDKPYCPDCFSELFSRRCKRCQKPISGFGGCKYVSLDKDNWHTDCFLCDGCEMTLVGKGFMNRDDKIFCVVCFNKTADNLSDTTTNKSSE